VHGASARLGHDLLGDQEAELDPDAGEADALPADLARRRDVVVARQFAAPHAVAVVDHGQRGGGGVGHDGDLGGAGVQGVRHDFGEDRLIDRARIRVPEVLEKVQEVDAGFAHEPWCAYSVSTKPAISSTWRPATAMDGA
jgi:hypothetical protein